MRRYFLPLLGTGRPAALDQALRLIQPGRSFVALVSGLLTVLAVTTRSDWLVAWPAWAAVTAVQVLEPIPFLAKEGVPARKLLRYPVIALLAALWIPVRLISSRTGGWYHTPHGASAENDEGAG